MAGTGIEQPLEGRLATQPTGVGNGRLGTNLTANLANFGVSVLVSVWFTPYLIEHLGVAGYGLIPLMTTVTSYLGLVTFGLNAAVGRYILIALKCRDERSANRFFNTSLVSSAALVVLLVMPAAWLSSHSGLLFRVPVGYEHDANLLFGFMIAMFMVATVSSPFEVATFCSNRFDLRSGLQIGATVVRAGGVVLLFSVAVPRVWHAGCASLVAAILSAVGAAWMWRKLTPQLSVAPADFSWRSLAELTSTGGWMVVNQVGTLLYLSIDLLVVNRMLGVDAGGHYAAVMQWSALLRGMAGAIAGVFGPTILAHYAHGDIDGLVSYSRNAVRLLGLIMALPIGLICGLSRPILSVWLGVQFSAFAPLMSLMTLHLCVNLSVLPLFSLQVATNRVRWPGIVTCVMGVANLGLAVLLTGPARWGVYGVAAAGAIMLTAKNAVYTPVYGAHIIGRSRLTFVREILVTCGLTVGVAGICWWGSILAPLGSWSRLFAASFATSVLYVTMGYLFILSPRERALGLQVIMGRHRAGMLP